MFKRVEKRRRKRAEEEELGLDNNMKEVLGIHDTDSEESDSDSDQSLSGDSDRGELDEDPSESFLDDGDVDEGGSASLNEELVITVQEALRDPVYLISLQPDVKACIVCPGKLLKGGKMAHIRRFKQFKILVERVNLGANAWDIVRQNTESKMKMLPLASMSSSRRAEKRKAKAAAHKEQRQKQKAKRKARKPVPIQESTSASTPPKKRQKVKEPERTPPATPPVHPVETIKALPIESTIKSIVRSTSHRAKHARARSFKRP
ncbi:hypothetical protein BDZ94DRAFT_1318120 [Collybia nuda]|uniref:Uncharacterized protein n=1 Tax=Collybia nuda TaxID=64659 RepID=A0A9P5YG32_9AGAR|nr:hypothetical protein BDZ94DRAFT_1318120 [Collybia nuda]